VQRPSRGIPPNTPAPGDIHPVLRTAAPSTASELLAEAQYRLDEAAGLHAPNERYAGAHLAALRAAAAVLAAPSPVPKPCPRGRAAAPKRRRARIRSVWESLPEAAPELAGWAGLFAAGASRRARAEAGIAGAASPAEADDVVRAASVFLPLVADFLAEQPALPAPRAR